MYAYIENRIQGMEQHIFKNVNNCLNTNIYTYLETSGGQSSNPYLNAVYFFQHQSYLDICGRLRQLFSCIGAQYVLFHWLVSELSLFLTGFNKFVVVFQIALEVLVN